MMRIVVTRPTLRLPAQGSQSQPREGVLGLVGDTPLIHLRSLSEGTGCTVYAKAEFLNPGGSIKDRVARQIVLDAERSGRLQPGALITEATAGSTGVALAMVAAARGYKCVPGWHIKCCLPCRRDES